MRFKMQALSLPATYLPSAGTTEKEKEAEHFRRREEMEGGQGLDWREKRMGGS